jgi:isopentenyl-diphosphate delta-isomerase
MKKHHSPRFDVLDRNGHSLGYTASIEEAYRQGLWHRSVQVLVYAPDGQILVQQRAAGSIILPSYLDMSAAGGVDPGETPLQAAARETREELGILAPLEHFEPLKVLRYNQSFRGQTVHSRAFIHSFLLQLASSDVPLHLQRKEVSQAKFVPLIEAKRLVGHHRLKWGKLIPRYRFYRYLIGEVERRLA